MWPLTGAEVVAACGGRCARGGLEGLEIAGTTVGATPCRTDEIFVAIREAGHDGHAFVGTALRQGAALAIVAADGRGLEALDPEAASRCVVVDDVIAAYRRLGGVLRGRFSFPVFAVGGSNGKTTTKDMLAALLGGGGRRVTKTPESMNGMTGVPWTLCQRAHARARPPDALVVEIGIDAPGAMADHAALVAPDVAVITALGVEHLAGLGSWERAVDEELRLFEPRPGRRRVFLAGDPALFARIADARAGDAIVCDRGEIDAVLARLGAATPEAIAGRGLDLVIASTSLAALRSEVTIVHHAPGARGPARGRFDVPLPGAHFARDFAVAAAAALLVGRSMDDLSAGWVDFDPPRMRLRPIPLANGAILLDDAYNASPSSVRAALEVVGSEGLSGRPRLVVIGDMLDLGAQSARWHLELCGPLRALEGAAIALYGDELRPVHAALAAEGRARLAWAPTTEDPSRLIDDLVGAGGSWAEALAGAVVLVKGSRGMRLERVVADLVARCELDDDATIDRIQGAIATVCVTGTNGKTTTSTLLAAVVAEAGEPAARVTTLGAWVDGELVAREATAHDFVRTAGRAVALGACTLVVETTSLALSQGFADRWPARVGVFTNLSRDHLDVHGSPEDYLAAKARLFVRLPAGGAAVLNAADPASALIDEVTPRGVRRAAFAARPVDAACAALPLVLAARGVEVTRSGTRLDLAPSALADRLGGVLELRLIGEPYAEDALAAAVAADALGYSAPVIRRALASFEGVPGRFQAVHRRPLVVVDYAHTPDALAGVLATARRLVEAGGKVVCVFGCGGDRDAGKRAEMGRIAGELADLVVVTTDNPRSEDPADIADQVLAGAQGTPAVLRRIDDRALAIEHAIECAGPADVVVLAGKGHEDVQIGAHGERPFDDAEVARHAAARRETGDR